MGYEHLEVSREGGVLIAALNDPAAMNAVSPWMLDELVKVVDEAEKDARVFVLTGAGKGFCAGANLSRLQGSLNADPSEYDPGRLLESHINPILKRLHKLPIPWISAVNGAAVGVGCGLGLSGDLVVCSEQAFFMFAFGRVGLAPDGGSSYLLSRAIGRVRASEMLLLGERLTAAQAHEWGLVNRVFSGETFRDETLALAKRLAEGPTRSYDFARRSLWQGMESSYEEALDLERVLQREAGATADHKEGISAFRDKRPAAFQGR